MSSLQDLLAQRAEIEKKIAEFGAKAKDAGSVLPIRRAICRRAFGKTSAKILSHLSSSNVEPSRHAASAAASVTSGQG